MPLMLGLSVPGWHKASSGRFYQAELRQNLLGEWVLIWQWDSLHRRGGHSLKIICHNYAEGLNQIDNIAKRRA